MYDQYPSFDLQAPCTTMTACSTASEPGGWLASTGSKKSGEESGTGYASVLWRGGQ
eukprot:CAMPEP_0115211964 /NCGR_PEP_ID=MMETSP0270-20121206/23034_1 /TAXON_ID=71861 /ORGANISM="Scrippsiella trochoidea, Strain CCMP3099" /LENGTH=55 /DNA_ID=CAMNT_0002625667 /DNA_START=387 /DNA_END=554 /DNA_ORIENTATION=+